MNVTFTAYVPRRTPWQPHPSPSTRSRERSSSGSPAITAARSSRRIEDGAFVVDEQAVAYWVGQAVELARQGLDIPDVDDEPVGYACAECGTQDATNYVVTILDHDDIRHTRTEVCIPCAITVSADSVDRIIAGIITR